MISFNSLSIFNILLLFCMYGDVSSGYNYGLKIKTIFHDTRSALASMLKNIDYLMGCPFYECCPDKNGRNQEWIRANVEELENTLDSAVHGQHLVKNLVIKALRAHLDDEPTKALSLSFHGWTGGGKNFVARLIAENIFKNGMKSRFVHLFISAVHFPHDSKVDIYKLQIQDWIRTNVSECEHSLFIFDEIDKMPEGLIDSIKPFIDYNDNIFGVDFRKSIFIFLSNTGSRAIIHKVLLNWRAGKSRTDITYDDMEDLVQKGAFTEKGGLHQSNLIQDSLIDFYVPFLPLERQHVELCIRDDMVRRKISPSSPFIKKVVESLIFFPPENKVFAIQGCKSVASKVGYFLVDERDEL